MRIVQFVSAGPAEHALDGALPEAVAQCRELERRGHDVILLVARLGDADLRVAGVRMVLQRVEAIPGSPVLRSPAVRAWLIAHAREIDVLHVHAGPDLLHLEVASTARRLGIRYVMQAHVTESPGGGTPSASGLRGPAARAIRGAAAVLARSDDEAATLRARFAHVTVLRVADGLVDAGPLVETLEDGIPDDLRELGPVIVPDAPPEVVPRAVGVVLADSALRERVADGTDAVLPELSSIGATVDALLALPESGRSAATRPSVVWVTNLAPPYRVPVWDALAREVDLEVWLLETDERLRSDDNNRGDDWTAGDRAAAYRTRFLPNRVVRRGEARHYVTGWLPRSSLRGKDAILIGGWDSPAYWVASWSAKLAGVRRVGFYESHRLSQQHHGGVVARVRRAFFRSMDEIVVPGIAAWEGLVAEGIDPQRIRVGFNAVDVEGIHARTRAARLAAGRPTGPVGSRLLCVGQLIPRKNVLSLIEALAAPELAACTLTVVGAGPEREALEGRAEELGLGSRITFAGYVPVADLPEQFARHDVLVHPALQEVWGLTVNEALAAGLTVVVGEHAGVTPSVRDMAGVIVSPVSVEGLRTGIAAAVPAVLIDMPEILLRTPAEFAATFRDAMLVDRVGSRRPERARGTRA
ncbi:MULTISPECIES: glycosyltransferase [Clavibacter]|uniref:D-inositol 3-phosphate glycosyltransferase n=1 Tax=Clavibacter tessellarius TaxID=31965 RepID=A0A154V0H8_9MICO|nr:glycosyltransferase [Clavibacter michiganensis]KZC94865.1 hypothetical protein AWH51_11870 [Clavibacter michiganensis subsp. tessellarius]